MAKSSFNKKNIPNILTILRIALVPIICIFILVDFGPVIYTINVDYVHIRFPLNMLLALILYLISAITDFLDGYLARKYNWVSNFGKLWDPLADKILTNVVILSFTYYNFIPIWLAIILLTRDIIIDGFRINCLQKNIVIPANIWGKIKTFLLMVGIIVVFCFSISNNNNWYYWVIQNGLIILATIFSIVSLIIYMYSFYKNNKKKEAEVKESESIQS